MMTFLQVGDASKVDDDDIVSKVDDDIVSKFDDDIRESDDNADYNGLSLALSALAKENHQYFWC